MHTKRGSHPAVLSDMPVAWISRIRWVVVIGDSCRHGATLVLPHEDLPAVVHPARGFREDVLFVDQSFAVGDLPRSKIGRDGAGHTHSQESEVRLSQFDGFTTGRHAECNLQIEGLWLWLEWR